MTRPSRSVRTTRFPIDQFLQGAVELDVDCVSDGETVVIGGIMEHVEEAGVHSGDLLAVCPRTACQPRSLTRYAVKRGDGPRIGGRRTGVHCSLRLGSSRAAGGEPSSKPDGPVCR